MSQVIITDDRWRLIREDVAEARRQAQAEVVELKRLTRIPVRRIATEQAQRRFLQESSRIHAGS